ncbi:hypothetical protein [Halorhabdus tiamatea]|uniref:hypothetical protein n=1 Tax=Halorhabdus tiamatea TaxID=430914 RepID=UPI001F589A51|nr:hypothetical protein [Halorhabdus tiamatea]
MSKLGGYPQSVRPASIKCIACNAPAVLTQDGEYVCVECGESRVNSIGSAGAEGELQHGHGVHKKQSTGD